MSQVCIKSGDNVYEASKRALEALNFSQKAEHSKILIKPNLTCNSSPESGLITHPDSVRALLEKIREGKIVIGEGSGESSAGRVFREQGYSELAGEFDLELTDFDKDEIVEKSIPDSLTDKKIPFAKTALESDYIISAAKLKTHSVTGVTLAMKNMFGAVPLRSNKLNYHFRISKAIPDFMKVVKPDFSIIEAFPGNQGDEVISNPVDSRIVIAGEDPLAVDTVGSLCMGINPEKIEHIELMKEQEKRDPEIEIVGDSIEEVRRNYRTGAKFSTKIRHGVEKVLSYIS